MDCIYTGPICATGANRQHKLCVHTGKCRLGSFRISNSAVRSTSYSYDESAGEGTCIYVLDTGIFVNDLEFEGRVTFVKELSSDGVSDDTVGHGTSVAAWAASKTYGTSKKAKLLAVKVVGGNGEIGDSSTVIAGMDFYRPRLHLETRRVSRWNLGQHVCRHSTSNAVYERRSTCTDRSGIVCRCSCGKLQRRCFQPIPRSRTSRLHRWGL